MSASSPQESGLPAGRVVVAVDGPAGSGKSSVSKASARRLGFAYLDTGAAYRALAWFVLDREVDTTDADAVVGLLPEFEYAISVDPDHYVVRVGDTDVTQAIRQPRVSAVVSHIARVPGVRQHLTDLFREVMAVGREPGIIVEGRDITTIVAPDAPVRVLLTASETARMGRRAAELEGQTLETVGRDLSARDAQDLKVVDFMSAAEGVTTLDSTNLDFEQTVDALVALIQAIAHPAGREHPAP